MDESGSSGRHLIKICAFIGAVNELISESGHAFQIGISVLGVFREK